MTKVEYRRYLRSKDFDERIRQPALRRAAGRCETCGAERPLQVHHDDYFTVKTANELATCRAVCRTCHLRAHGHATRPMVVATRFAQAIEASNGRQA